MNGRVSAKYKLGDYLIVYSGANEGCCFTVRGVRWSDGDVWRDAGWEYDTGPYGWRSEDTISTEAYARLFA